jgi:hypothetical protein
MWMWGIIFIILVYRLRLGSMGQSSVVDSSLPPDSIYTIYRKALEYTFRPGRSLNWLVISFSSYAAYSFHHLDWLRAKALERGITFIEMGDNNPFIRFGDFGLLPILVRSYLPSAFRSSLALVIGAAFIFLSGTSITSSAGLKQWVFYMLNRIWRFLPMFVLFTMTGIAVLFAFCLLKSLLLHQVEVFSYWYVGLGLVFNSLCALTAICVGQAWVLWFQPDAFTK